MADINQVITLGIGTPSGIKEFLTFGLQLGTTPVATETRMRGENQIIMPSQNRSMFMSNSNRSIIMPSRKSKVKL